MKIPCCWKKPGSPVLYFRRKVPLDLIGVLGKTHVVQSLKTTDPLQAAPLIAQLIRQTDKEWGFLRSSAPGKERMIVQEKALSMLREHGVDPVQPADGPLFRFHDILEEKPKLSKVEEAAVAILKGSFGTTLGDCLAQYTAARPSDDTRCERAFRYLIEYLGTDKELRAVRRQDANGFIKWLLNRDMSTATVQRYIAPIKAAVSRAIRENELKIENVFAKLEIPDYGKDSVDREVFTEAQFRSLEHAIEVHGQDTLRSILTVVAETGARLAEIVGLAKGDIHGGKHPHITLKPHPWRTLKTPGSTRRIPLTDRAWQCLRDAKNRSGDAVRIYPQYASSEPVSAALVKWIRSREGLKGTKLGVHSLRHTVKDQLRAVQCPLEIMDALLGHVTPGVGAGYGEGYPIEVLAEWMNKKTPTIKGN
jgi:integrase